MRTCLQTSRRIRGSDDLGDAPRPRLSMRSTPAMRRHPSAVSQRRSLKYWICKRAARRTRSRPGVPRRQRLRRGVRDAAPLSREPRSTRSGRARATSSASTSCGRWSRARLAGGLLRRGRWPAQAAEPSSPPTPAHCATAPRRPGDDRVPGPPPGRAHGAGPAGFAPGSLWR